MLTLKPLLLTLAVSLTLATVCQAQDNMDVDQADRLDFEAFHKEKKDAIKLWDDKKVDKVYKDHAKDNKSVKADHGKTNTASTKTRQQSQDKSGKRYEIRELYSITGSDRTGYTPTTVVQALYLQMQGLCPKGWKKLGQRSKPDGDDALYMYYTFECL